MAAATKPTSSATKMTKTSVVAAQRGRLRLTNQDAAGSSPKARKNATPIRTSVDDNDEMVCTTAYVTATPAAPVSPM